MKQIEKMSNIISSFIIGSSFPIISIPAVLALNVKNKNYDMTKYLLTMPLYFGAVNTISYLLWPVQTQLRYLMTGLISGLIVSVWAYYIKSYKPTPPGGNWSNYTLLMLFMHVVIFEAIFGITLNVCSKK